MNRISSLAILAYLFLVFTASVPFEARANLLSFLSSENKLDDSNAWGSPKGRVSNWVERKGLRFLTRPYGKTFSVGAENVVHNRGFLQRTVARANEYFTDAFKGERVDADSFFKAVRDDANGTARRNLETVTGLVSKPAKTVMRSIRHAGETLRYVKGSLGESNRSLPDTAADDEAITFLENEIQHGVSEYREKYTSYNQFDNRSTVVVGESEQEFFEENSSYFAEENELPHVMEDEFIRHEVEEVGLTVEQIVYDDPLDDPFAIEKYQVYEREAFEEVVETIDEVPPGWEEITGDDPLPNGWEELVPNETLPAGWVELSDEYEEYYYEPEPQPAPVRRARSRPDPVGDDFNLDLDSLDSTLDGFVAEAVQQEDEIPISRRQADYSAGSVSSAVQGQLKDIRAQTDAARERSQRAAMATVNQQLATKSSSTNSSAGGSACPVDVPMPECCRGVRQDRQALYNYQGELRAWQRQSGNDSRQYQQLVGETRRMVQWADDFIAQNCN